MVGSNMTSRRLPGTPGVHPPRAPYRPPAVDRFQYLLVLGLCLVGTLPLELALGVRVWRRPARLARSVLPVAAIFCVYDVLAIDAGWWDYDPRYVTGLEVGFGLPLEELAFFLVIPVCGILTIEAVRVRLRRR